MVMSRVDELSVKLNSLQAEHEHLINEHWMPLQQFASGVVACLSVLAGMDPDVASPLFCSECGRGGAPSPIGGSSFEDGQGCVAPIPSDSSPMISGPSASTPPTSLPPSPPSPVSCPSSRLHPVRSPFYTPPHRRPIPSLVSILVILLMFLIGLII